MKNPVPCIPLPPPLTLSPLWRPICFEAICAPFPATMFDTTIIDELGIVIAGGPALLSVFLVLKQQRLWFSIPGRIGLAGYAVDAGLLYVQDGPVLSCWDLNAPTDGAVPCAAAINLSQPSRERPSGGQPLTAAELDAIYACDAGYTAQRTPYTQADCVLSWVKLVSAVEAVAASGEAPLPGPSGFDSFGAWIREALFGSAGETIPVATLLANASDDVRQAQATAGAALFSAPVVRSQRMGAPSDGVVFVLVGDGRLFALDAMLAKARAAKFDDTPAILQLAIYEASASDDPTALSCRLCYFTEQYAIREIDASSIPLKAAALSALGTWRCTGMPVHTLPLKFVDERLCGGGLQGQSAAENAFFMLAPDPRPDLSWSHLSGADDPYSAYEVDADSQLVLVGRTRTPVSLYAYGPDAGLPYRWDSDFPGYATFWRASDGAPEPSTALLVLGADDQPTAGQSDPTLYAAVANTVKAPLSMNGNYPPYALTHVVSTGTLTTGDFQPGMGSVNWIRGKPAISRQSSPQTAFVVAQQKTFSQVWREWLTPDPVTNMSPFFIWSGYITSMDRQPLPMLGGPDYLLAYSMDAMAAQAVPAANTQLQQLNECVTGIAIEIHLFYRYADNGVFKELVADIAFQLQIDGAPPFDVATCAPGLLILDAKYNGRTATMCASAPLINRATANDNSLFAAANHSWSSTAEQLQLECVGVMLISIAQNPPARG